MGGTLWRQTPEEPPPYHGNDWHLLVTSTINKWMLYDAAFWGFDDRITYADYGIMRVNPAALTGRNLQAFIQQWPTDFPEFLEFTGVKDPADREEVRTLLLLERYDSEGGHIYYTVLAPDSYIFPRQAYLTEGRRQDKYLKTVNLIGFHKEHAILQVITAANQADILVLENYQIQGFDFRVKSIYSMDFPCTFCLLEGYISPDFTKCIVKPCNNYCALTDRTPAHDVIQLIDISGQSGRLDMVLFDGESQEVVIAFDPRFRWRRIVIGDSVQKGESSSTVRIYDLMHQSTILESDPSYDQLTQNLVYSPDGLIIASLNIETTSYGDSLHLKGVIIYDSDSLVILKHIDSTLHTICQMAPACIFPHGNAVG
jgi:hypothetical protein